jgi:hypothetical protein
MVAHTAAPAAATDIALTAVPAAGPMLLSFSPTLVTAGDILSIAPLALSETLENLSRSPESDLDAESEPPFTVFLMLSPIVATLPLAWSSTVIFTMRSSRFIR